MIDYIIVGQGIAGSWLTWFLIQNGSNVMVFDPGKPSSASTIASGIINPVTGRRLVKTWMADTLIPFALTAYQTLEEHFQSTLIRKVSIYKMLTSIANQNEWSTKVSDPEYQPYLISEDIHYPNKELLDNPFGCFRINGALVVDGKKLILQFRNWLQVHERLTMDLFDYNKLELQEDHVTYGNLKAKAIIFCEGAAVSKNPFFQHLPFAPVKGEALLIHAPDLKIDFILNGRVIILPVGDDHYYVGATKDWEDLTEHTTETMRTKLISSLQSMILVSFKIIDQFAGIRPATKDRRPIIGRHSQYKNIYIFNGMGTKGYSLSPYFAKMLTSHLLTGEPLLSEVAVDRFKTFSNK